MTVWVEQQNNKSSRGTRLNQFCLYSDDPQSTDEGKAFRVYFIAEKNKPTNKQTNRPKHWSPFSPPFQRSPTPSSGSPDPSISSEDGSCQSPTRFRSFSESFFTVKGAAIVLPRSEIVRHITATSTSGSTIQVQWNPALNGFQGTDKFYLLRAKFC